MNDINVNNDYTKMNNISPFKLCVIQNFPFIEADFDAVTNYQLLCKVVEYLNNVIDNNNKQNTNITQIEQNFITLYNYVKDYFDNLDVQEEINNKLDEMASDGSLSRIIQPLFDEYKTTIDSEVNVQNDKIIVLENRMDTFTSLTEGSTTGDAELIDIRVPASGFNYNETYSTAGEAVRGQVSALKEDLVSLSNDLFDFVDNNILKLPSIFVKGNLDDNGEIVPNPDRYTSEKYIKVSLDCTLKTLSVVVVCLYNDDLSIISRTVYTTGTVTISKNSIFRICVIGFDNSAAARESVYFYPNSSFKNVLEGSNICFNDSTIPDGNIFDFNKSFESKIYEFDIYFDNTKVLNAPFYPFKGTAIVFSPCGIKELYKGDSDAYYAVGTVQMIFKSRNMTNYDGTYYIRCYLSGNYDNPIWSEWKEYKEAEYFNNKFNAVDSKFTDIDVNGCDLFQCFENFCVIGDSISAGFTNIGGVTINSETARRRGANWPTYLSLYLSREVLNISVGGSSTIDWRNTLKNNISKKECFIIYLGGNDMANNYTLGNSDDIKADYNENSESYYGNYDYLIRYIHENYPNSVILCISNTFFDNERYKTYNSACQHIANLYSYCHYIDIIDEVEKQNSFLSNNFNGHFSPIGYKVYEKCIRNSINKYMYENYNKFLGVPYSTD